MDEHKCYDMPDNVDISRISSVYDWMLYVYSTAYEQFDDDGLIGYQEKFTLLEEVAIKYCPFCGEKLD